MKKGYVYAMMAAVAAMTVSGCSSSSSAPASTAAESKTEAAASSESGTTAADTSDVKAAVDTIKFGLVAPLSGDNGAYGTKQEKGYELAMEEINAAGGVLGATEHRSLQMMTPFWQSAVPALPPVQQPCFLLQGMQRCLSW